MNQSVGPFSQQFDVSRSLSIASLTGLEAILSFQFDHAQALATRSSTQLKTALSESTNVNDPAQLLDLMMQQWAAASNILLHDSIISAVDYHIEIFRLLQLQAAETRDLIAESLRQQVVPIEQFSSRNRLVTKTSAFQQMKAA